ncbi:hypothetical protein [Gracilinema caldarium]|uniref:hypothetical protein n=1 Tax=Gracilinema caldarium TaxID=215591 RepID=UPI0026F0B159|nr:hypothetical protein [Gracilinema caldarium]
MKHMIALAGLCTIFLSCAGTQVVPNDTKSDTQPRLEVLATNEIQKKNEQTVAKKTITIQIPVEVKSVVKFADNTIDEYTVSVWDEKRWVLQNQTRYSASGAVLEKIEYFYVGNQLAEKVIKDRDDKIVSRRAYSYNANGLLIGENVTDANGKLVSSYEYVYDNQKNKISWIVKDNNNSKVAETKYTYINGKVRSAVLTDATDKKNGSSVYDYDSNGNLSQVSYFNALDSLLRKEFSYWDKGLLVKEERTSAGGQVLQRTTYEYGPNKELVRKIVEDLQGKSKQIVEFEYSIRTETKVVE